MHVTGEGSGPDLVLLHGWGMNAGVWNEVATLLAPRFRVHCVDLPGQGRNSRCVPYTLDAVADALAAASPPRATVCGWSLGGQIALRWAMMHPAQVERLVLIASTPRFVREAGWDAGMEPAVFDAFAQDLAQDPRGTLNRFVLLQAHGDTAARKVSQRLRDCVAECDANVEALAAALQVLKQTDLRADLSRITQPVLILHGDRDTVVPAAAGEYLARTLPGAELRVIAGAAHAPFIAAPHEVANSIAEFCHG